MGSIRASWISVAGDGLALVLVDLSNRIRQRRFAVYLMFALCILSAAVIAVFELGMMRAETPERWAQLLRWVHLPLTLLMVSFVLFVRLQFRASRRGWPLPLIAISLAALAANFLTGANLEFREITALRPIPVWQGVPLNGAIGVRNPWIILIATNVVLMVAFLLDTIRATHKHGDPGEREKAVPVCLSILVFVLLAGVWELLVAYGLIVGPLFVALPFLGISLVMAYFVGSDALHAAAYHIAANERLVSLVDSMPCAVLLVNGRGSIRFVNKRAEGMFRYARAQLIGMRIETLIPARSGAAYVDLREKFAGDQTARATAAGVEWTVLREDGSEIVVEIDMSPMETDREQLTVVSITDISERKRSEREAALQRDELAHLSRAASLSALSGSLAHELVQPLTAILSNAQAGVRLLANQPSNLEEVRASLGYIVDNAKRASDVIRKLRSMLRKDPTEFMRLDINDVVREIMQIVRSDLIERRVDVVLDLQEDLAQISGDRVQLQQVMMNLMMNAADAMSANASARTLTIHTIATAADEIEVQVADTGTGIPEGDVDRIFAPFVTSKSGGMGLGLSVCTMLIHAHAGRLWATNNNAGGATLHFRLPRSADVSNPYAPLPRATKNG